jgi:hypothetical protein
MLVACGLMLEDLVAAAPSASERDWMEGSQRPPELEITGVTDEHVHTLNGTK